MKTADLGPKIDEKVEGEHPHALKLEPVTSSSSSELNTTSPATPYEHAADQDRWEGTQEKDMSEIKKLQVIVEEFGEMATLMENADGSPAESERIIAESHGSLYR